MDYLSLSAGAVTSSEGVRIGSLGDGFTPLLHERFAGVELGRLGGTQSSIAHSSVVQAGVAAGGLVFIGLLVISVSLLTLTVLTVWETGRGDITSAGALAAAVSRSKRVSRGASRWALARGLRRGWACRSRSW
ncbi:MAG: hypothetical protein NVSMB51_12890 [Solirubrobacteraceae bacterium]